MSIDDRLDELGLVLPEPMAPVANYVPFVVSGNQVFISGQISKVGDEIVRGRLGEGLSVADGQRAARLCGLNIVAQLSSACGGDLSRVRRIVKLGGFVQSTPDATGPAIPQVINGCSDLMVALFGEAGRHARFAVSAPSLPLNVAVEIDCIAEIDPD
ncbi:MAG: RidA family protein [Litorimonas sp.]